MTPCTVALPGRRKRVRGAVNAIAGGGSPISFPSPLAVGYPPVTANVSNTVALASGYAGSVAGCLAATASRTDRSSAPAAP